MRDLPPFGRPQDRKPNFDLYSSLLTMDRSSASERTERASHTGAKQQFYPKPTTRFPTHHTPSVLPALSFPYLGLGFQFLLFKGTLLREQKKKGEVIRSLSLSFLPFLFCCFLSIIFLKKVLLWKYYSSKTTFWRLDGRSCSN